jgi:PilZ domain
MLNTMKYDLGSSTGTGSAERRQFPRYPFTATLEAFESASQTRIQGRTADLSRGGCYVDTMSPFPAQTRVKVRITKDQRSFEGHATVIYSVTGMGMGLRFEALEPKELMALRKWVGELSGEAIAEAEIEQESSSARVTDLTSVLSELISELMRKGVLPADKGASMLQRVTAA